MFRSDNLALDFAATLASRLKPEPRELLALPRDLGRWLVAAGLVPDHPEVTETELFSARDLREAVYRLARNRIKAEAPADEDLAVLNRWAALPPPSPQLGREGLSWIGRGVDANLARIAREAVELLGGPSASRIRNCARPGCSILFFDTSRSGQRRWCSMTACGNKAKVDAFRKRRKLDS